MLQLLQSFKPYHNLQPSIINYNVKNLSFWVLAPQSQITLLHFLGNNCWGGYGSHFRTIKCPAASLCCLSHTCWHQMCWIAICLNHLCLGRWGYLNFYFCSRYYSWSLNFSILVALHFFFYWFRDNKTIRYGFIFILCLGFIRLS